MAWTDSYPAWIFDDSPIDDPFGFGERAVKFLRALKHPKTGKGFQLDPWQERIVRRIYGPRKPDGTRIVKNVVMMVPRGARKTTLGAALGLLHTIGPEKVPGGQIICAAYDRDQARIAYEEASGIVCADKRIQSVVRMLDYRHQIIHSKSRANLRAVSSDAAAQNGRTPSFVLFDEIHAWRDRKLYDVLRTGLSKTSGTLSVTISQAGRGQENVAYEIFDYARKVARGEIEDAGTLPILFETAQDADWRDEDVWFKCNPGLALGYPDLDALRQEAREAENRPALREKFKNDHLNIWLDHSSDPFVDMQIYDQGSAPIDLDALAGQPCWLGVDLSSNGDLTCIVAAWRDGKGGYIVHPWFFCPADNLRRRADKDGVPYPTWAEDGFILPTEGNVVDFRYVEGTIRDLCERFDVREIAFDPHLARNMLNNLLEDGFAAVEFRQGWVSMAPAIKELERSILSGKFQHGGHPVLRWNFDNIACTEDSAGNRAFNKGKSRDRIDGAVATAMAVARAFSGDDERSVYSDISERPDGLLFF
ncbi:terminase large subunit [Methylocapsa aurea]|uniref:terminase large subunit n=1 Tax=Methylocapsa aurea TaxID=663610 RepID=UPI00056AF217|nr:terminase TerL endonuclease subunit [Methylocapsa aurea]